MMARIIGIILLFCIAFVACDLIHFKEKKGNNGQNSIDGITIIHSALIDSLKNYDFHLVAGKQKKMRGAAFFLNFHSKNYIISAFHNFTGFDPENSKLIEGLSESPKEIFVYQFDTILDSPWGESYNLYKNNNPVFMTGKKGEEGYTFDIGAYPVSAPMPLPNHILKYDVKWKGQILNVNDTIFYWGFVMNKENQAMFPTFYTGKIKELPRHSNPYIVSDIFSKPGNSGAPVFKISNGKVYLIGIISRGNSDAKIVYITPLEGSFGLFKL